MQLAEKIQLLKPHKQLLNHSLMGIEKEGLRISTKGEISQTPHPKIFGCALTHQNITTDFCEALIELVTPPQKGADKTLSFLADTQHYLYHHLPKNQRLWPSSMPCVIRGETAINIAQYGTSNLGLMKTIYRQGLANRYGNVMQTISGIHFNYSFSKDFLHQYHKLSAPKESFRIFNDTAYMNLTRNIIRYGWLIPYLFGASNAVCKSFLKDADAYSLIKFNHNTLFEPYATSLRMGDIGYQNLHEDKAGVKANYNSLNHYIGSLEAGMNTSCAEYEAIGLKKHDKYQQLNTNILQIENEYYASVRPKPLPTTNKKPLNTLKDSGIDYIELRSIDINPLLKLGIDKTQIHFLEAFLLFCLLEPSAAIATSTQFEIDNNDQLVAHKGRTPNLMLTHKSKPIPLKVWGAELINNTQRCSALFGNAHQAAVRQMMQRIQNPNLTPSAIMLNEMKQRKQGFFDYINTFAKQYHQDFLRQKINQQHFDYLDAEAQLSCKKQAIIENADKVNFDQFLADYFASN